MPEHLYRDIGGPGDAPGGSGRDDRGSTGRDGAAPRGQHDSAERDRRGAARARATDVSTVLAVLAVAVLVWCCLLAAPAGADAATYYVSPDGDDGAAGTEASPWRSPGLASKRLNGGDTLVILGGRYVLRTFWDDMVTPPSGSAGSPTRIVGEAGDRPVLAGRDNLFSAVDVSGTSYVTLENLEITSDGGALFRTGVQAAGDPVDHLVLRDLSIHHIDEMGLDIGDVDDLLVERCTFSHCGFGCIGGPAGAAGGNRDIVIRDCYLGYSGHYYQGGPGPGPYDRPDGFGIEPSAGPVLIEHSLAEHNRGDGLDSKAAATTIRRCVVANNRCDGVKMWAGGRVENTLIYGTGDGSGGASPWAGMVLGGEPDAHFEIVNVTVHDDPSRHAYPVYMQYSEPEPMTVLMRNVVVANGHGPVFLGDAVTAHIDHCDFYRPAGGAQVYTGGREYTAAELEAGALGPGNLSADPGFAAPAWGSDGDFHLTAGSPLIDAGDPTGAPSIDLEGLARPAGAAPDIGAHEYGATGTPDPPSDPDPAPTPGPAPGPGPAGPRVDDALPRAVKPGGVVTISGSGFGARRDGSWVRIGSRRARVYRSWSDTLIRVQLPSGQSGRAHVTVGTAAGRSERITIRVRPRITGMAPGRIARGASGGARVLTIRGRAFGRTRGSSFVTVGGVRVTRCLSWSQTRLRVRVPAGVRGIIRVRVHTAGGPSNTRPLSVR